MSKEIIVVKPKTLSSAGKAKLAKEGKLVIEHPFPTEIQYRPEVEHLPYVFTNCCTCGCRIYMLKEQLAALRSNYESFWCWLGHSQSFTRLKQ